jgi:hypothetical protein
MTALSPVGLGLGLILSADVVYWAKTDVVRFQDGFPKGCIDFGRSKGFIFCGARTLRSALDDGVTFSFLFSLYSSSTALLLPLRVTSGFETRFDDGAEKSEYTLGLGVALDDDERLPGSEGVCLEYLPL